MKELRRGVVIKWTHGEPKVANGLRVVDDMLSKPRLCPNTLYVNAYLKHRQLTYERIGDVQGLVEEDDYLYTTLDISGYWQLDVAPDFITYLGFMWTGDYYAFSHLPFRVASTCYAYSYIKAVLYRPFRKEGG